MRLTFNIRTLVLALGLSGVATGPVAALELREATPSMNWAYTVQKTEHSIVITLRDFDATGTITTNGLHLDPAGPVAWPAPGKPRLPIVVLLFEVADNEAYEVTWSATSYEEFPRPLLVPVTAPDLAADAGRDDVVYRQDAYWPATLVHQEEARGAEGRFLRVEIYPLQIQPMRQLLRAQRGFKVVVSRMELARGK